MNNQYDNNLNNANNMNNNGNKNKRHKKIIFFLVLLIISLIIIVCVYRNKHSNYVDSMGQQQGLVNPTDSNEPNQMSPQTTPSPSNTDVQDSKPY